MEPRASAPPRQQPRSLWHSSPVVVAAVTAALGLLGTGAASVLQGWNETRLERQQFEADLIKEALQAESPKDRATNLLFLIDVGLIEALDARKIRGLAERSEALPQFTRDPQLRTAEVSTRRLKALLKAQGYYDGSMDDAYGPEVQRAVAAFQRDQGLVPDGVAGPSTVRSLLGADGRN